MQHAGSYPRLYKFNEIYPEITIHLETSTKPFLFSEHIFDAAIYTGTPAQIENWPGAKVHYLMNEDVVPVCSAELIFKHFPELREPSGDLRRSLSAGRDCHAALTSTNHTPLYLERVV